MVQFFPSGRRTDCKAGKHPFLISFNPSRRIHSGSGNDSFGLGGGSDLTTSGVPLDLSTLEPLWNQEVNSLYGIGKSDLISFDQVTQISAANIRFQRYIGCGAFGKVWEGWLHVNDVDGDRFEKVALKVSCHICIYIYAYVFKDIHITNNTLHWSLTWQAILCYEAQTNISPGSVSNAQNISDGSL